MLDTQDVMTAVRSYLPKWAAEAVLAQMKDAEQLKKLALYHERVKRQHQARTDGLEALIAGYCTGRTYESLAVCHRAQWVRDRLLAAVQRGDIEHCPSLKVIRRVVYGLAKAQKQG